jgi:two-component system sensor histidine kinase HydH
MFMMSPMHIRKLPVTAVAILAAGIVLAVLFGAFAFQSYRGTKSLMEQHLRMEAATLVRALEAGSRASMAAQDWHPRQLQRLLEETGEENTITYVGVVDASGTLLAHSRRQLVGERWTESELFQKYLRKKQPIWQLIPQEGGGKKFVWVSPFRPPAASDSEELAIVIALRTELFEAVQFAHFKRTLVMTIILLVVGFSAFYFLFMAQNYYATRKTLDEVQSYTKNIVESMPNGLITLDKDERVVTINSLAAKILGLNGTEVTGRRMSDVMHRCDLRQTFLPARDYYERRVQCHLNDGRVVPLSTTTSRLVNESGEVLGKVILIRDLTEMQELEERVRRSERLASLGKMAAGIAHEVRNPLSSIRGFAKYFRKKFQPQSEEAGFAEMMVKEVDRLNRVVEGLLNFARPKKLNKASTDLREIVSHALKLIEPEASSKEIQIVNKVPGRAQRILADVDLLTQALMNLLINALEAMDRGGQLTVELVQEPGQTILRVSDTGRGIPESEVSKIFDPFFTSKKDGTGLGLAIVHRIIEDHGGTIRVKSQPGKGTTFEILLPQGNEATPVAERLMPQS